MSEVPSPDQYSDFIAEMSITKIDILSFVILKYSSLVHVIILIWILQCGTLDGTVFC